MAELNEFEPSVPLVRAHNRGLVGSLAIEPLLVFRARAADDLNKRSISGDRDYPGTALPSRRLHIRLTLCSRQHGGKADSMVERGEFELPVPICEQSDDSIRLSFAISRRTAKRYRPAAHF